MIWSDDYFMPEPDHTAVYIHLKTSDFHFFFGRRHYNVKFDIDSGYIF